MTTSIRSPDILDDHLMNRAVAAINDFNNGRYAQFLAALPDILKHPQFKPAAEDADAPIYTPNAFHRLLIQILDALRDIYLSDVYQDYIQNFSPSVIYHIMRLLDLLLPRAKKDIESISPILESVVAALTLLLSTSTGMQVFMDGPPARLPSLDYFRIFLDYIVLFSSSECTTSVVSHIQLHLALITAPRNQHASRFWDYFASTDTYHAPLLGGLQRICALATELRLEPRRVDIPEYVLTNVLCVALLGSHNLNHHKAILQRGLVPSLVLLLDRSIQAGQAKPAMFILAQLHSLFLVEVSDAFGTALSSALTSGLVVTLSLAVDLLGKDNMDLPWVKEIFAMIADAVRCRPSMASIVRRELLAAKKSGLGKDSLPHAWQLLLGMVFVYTDEIDGEVAVRCGNYPRCPKPFAAERVYHYCPCCQRFLTCSYACMRRACALSGVHDNKTCRHVDREHD